MGPLDYLGLGGPTPGTMPAAVPGAVGTPIPPLDLAAASSGGGRGGMPPGAVPAPMPSPPPGGGGMPPGAIPGMPSPFLPPGGAPSLPEYVTETQADGSILLFMRLPDGSKGPAVKIVNPIKPRQPLGQQQQPGAPAY